MFQTLAQGGLIMIPIGICSLLGLTVIIERFIALRRARVIPESIIDLTERYSADTSIEKAVQRCDRERGAFARIIRECITARRLEHAQVIETMHATGRTQVGRLERGLIVLEIVANITPLLGLLGTVLGMITVFNAITVQGVGNPQVLSDGISKALITTVAGLSVAIPAVACHSWLSRRIDDYATEMQERATVFIVRLLAIERERDSDD